jgi:hypothetical protein
MAHLVDTTGLAVSDFALDRQSRWREAIAAIFDDPDFLPYLRSLRRIAVTYSTHDETGAAGARTSSSRHHAWLACHQGWCAPLHPIGAARPTPRETGADGHARPAPVRGGFDAKLRLRQHDVDLVLRPPLGMSAAPRSA